MTEMKSSEQILFTIKRHGQQSVKMLADQLSMTTMGVRQHLHQLEQQGLVEFHEQKVKVGRPTRFWRLTASGHARFPDSHSDLSVQLLSAVEQVFGDEGLEQLVAQREQQSLANYQRLLSSLEDVEAKLDAFTRRRSEEGYLASWAVHDQGYLFIEDHCPICAAASACQKLCRSELAMLGYLFEGYQVSRQEHIVQGARRCAYYLVKS